MITREELERDRQDIQAQLNRLQGAMSYVQQKIAALDKLEEKKATDESAAVTAPTGEPA